MVVGYPTLNGFLDDNLKDSQKKVANRDRLKKIISMCHTDHNWSVDVYDGQTPKLGDGTEYSPHIHHSDLIILDYHLDGTPDVDDGKRARNIVNQLAVNNHFNLVVMGDPSCREEHGLCVVDTPSPVVLPFTDSLAVPPLAPDHHGVFFLHKSSTPSNEKQCTFFSTQVRKLHSSFIHLHFSPAL
ncbi:MAG: hypothetical protein ACI8PB_001813 [Desulforhopalus sp.]|jgi:hypothetical protein